MIVRKIMWLRKEDLVVLHEYERQAKACILKEKKMLNYNCMFIGSGLFL